MYSSRKMGQVREKIVGSRRACTTCEGPFLGRAFRAPEAAVGLRPREVWGSEGGLSGAPRLLGAAGALWEV